MTNSVPSEKSRPNEMLYLGAFALGMLFLWLSGHAGIAISASHPGLNYVVNFLISATIYGLGAALLVYFAAGRKIWTALIIGLMALIIAPALAFGIGKLFQGHMDSKQTLGIFTFALYLIFGALYAVLLGLGRKLSRRRLARAGFDTPTDSQHNK